MKRELVILVAVFFTVISFGQATADPSDATEQSTLTTTNHNSEQPDDMAGNHYVGEILGGGIVFYVDERGKHGLITATIDKSTRKQQNSESFVLTNPVRDGITTGTFNTERINVMKGEESSDNQEVANNQEVKLSDWYLPTRYDLLKLYRNRSAIGGYAKFSRGWRSAEYSSVNEWYRSFITGGEFRNGKDDAVYIRVIRQF